MAPGGKDEGERVCTKADARLVGALDSERKGNT